MQILSGHISPETAYVVEDYPYGFRLRCKIRYWLETHPTHGCRLVSQTTNPKRGHVWNKPKVSTYCKFGACLVISDSGRVNWTGLTEYSSGAEARAWSEKFGAGVPEGAKKRLAQWVAAKTVFDANREQGVDPIRATIRADVAAMRVRCTCDAGGSAGCPVHDVAVTQATGEAL